MPTGTPASLGTFTRGQVGAVGSFSFTTTAAIAAGDLAFVVAAFNGAASPRTVTSVSDGTNSYSLAARITNGTDTTELWYCENCAAVSSGATITITFTGTYGGSGYGTASAAKVSGAATSSALDKTATQATSGTAPSVTTAALSQADELLIGVTYNDDSNPTFTEDASFSTIHTTGSAAGSKHSLSYRIVSSTNAPTYAPTWGTSGTLSSILATFKAPVSVFVYTEAGVKSDEQVAWQRKHSVLAY